ncbi:ribosome maturation factor RimM [Lacticaseibacillus thailandensis]|uniref:Ribosome maturation factor RimM n=1 Tax=Lacticaseibacillus thailandensis DSM 22698 = JCM 13996 TaxID=1423810 RepID=A0A0R2C8V3_9LACO|nr:ribosome maturation factor RimM [Lacticaseibacillus thailandensis]KRM88225.1 RimM protein, required for 16S rRNA processing [Lacticaseibacillus thailandensis DSM 22698 = JCM 13996]
MSAYLHVGKIVNTHGIRGEVKVMPNTDFAAQRFAAGAELVVLTTPPVTVTIASVRIHKGLPLLTFRGYDDINQVLPFKGAMLGATGTPDVELEDDEFMYKDVIGLTVVDTDGHTIGTVREILSPGANDVWVVDRPGHQDLLLPYLHSVMLNVDLTHQQVIVDVPEGLDPEDAN